MNDEREDRSMNDGRWRRVEALFHAAVAQPPDEREAFVERSGEPDDVRREVLELLAHDDDPGVPTGLRAALAGAASRALEAHARGRWAGRRIGPYRVEREIGRGGMGVVLLAERTDGAFERKVAIKLSLTGLVSGPLADRLESERRILAGLDDPAIARLLDGGTTEDGAPYVVMEYVEGTPIDEHCERHALGLRERMRLFLEICGAVDHAHHALVVHRDIKPSNILVTEAGQPKLLDFGIAKLLDPQSDPNESPATRTALRALTPEYASPEQLQGEPITTATDVYALGVVLYELLTGSRPFSFDSASPIHIERAVLTQDPPRPSSLCTGSAARALRGDLDRIVQMALRKEPERRYATARELAEDLRRFLEGHPVQARADTPGYRLRRFVGRHRAGTAAALLAALALAAGLTYHTDRLADERDRALREAEKSERIAEYLQQVFEANAPTASEGAEVKAIDLLDRSAETLATELSDEPGLRIDMLIVMGNTYRSLAAYDEAESLLREALELVEETGTAGSIRHGEVLVALGSLLAAQDRTEDAEQVTEQARAIFVESDPASPRAATALHNLAFLRWRDARHEEALALAERAHERRAAMFGEDHPRTLTSRSLVARAHAGLGNTDAALGILEEVLDDRRRVLGEDHPDTAQVLADLAGLEEQRGEFDSAVQRMERAFAIKQRIYPDDHPVLGVAMLNLASSLESVDRFSRAEMLSRRALEIFTARLPPGHARIALARARLADALLGQGRIEEALELRRTALGQLRNRYGNSHPRVVAAMHNLAFSEYQLGDFTAARDRLERVAREWERLRGPDHHYVAFARAALGNALIGLAQPEAAREQLLHARNVATRALGERSPQVAAHWFHLGRAALLAGDLQSAREQMQMALELREEQAGEEGDLALADSIHGFGELALAERRWDEALSRFESALEMRRSILDDGAHPEIALSLAGVSRAHLGAGRPRAALRAAQEAAAVAREAAAPPPALGRVLKALGRASAAAGDLAGARGALSQGVAALETCHPPQHPDVEAARRALASLE